jgi:hypothetical protein
MPPLTARRVENSNSTRVATDPRRRNLGGDGKLTRDGGPVTLREHVIPRARAAYQTHSEADLARIRFSEPRTVADPPDPAAPVGPTACWLATSPDGGPEAGCTPDERTWDVLARARGFVRPGHDIVLEEVERTATIPNEARAAFKDALVHRTADPALEAPSPAEERSKAAQHSRFPHFAARQLVSEASGTRARAVTITSERRHFMHLRVNGCHVAESRICDVP